MGITELACIATRVAPPRTGMEINDGAIHRQFVRRNEIPAIPRHPELHLFPTVMQLHLRMRYGFFSVNQHAHRAVTTLHPHPLLLGIQPAEHLDVRGFQEILQERFAEFYEQMFGGTIIGDSHVIIPHFAAICQDFLRDIFHASETDGAARCEMIPPVCDA